MSSPNRVFTTLLRGENRYTPAHGPAVDTLAV